MSALELRPEAKAAVEKILDTFTGADGGVSFMQFRHLIEKMDRDAAGGDQAAQQMVDIVIRMARLIGIAQRLPL